MKQRTRFSLSLSAVGLGALLLSGCYTQLATVDTYRYEDEEYSEAEVVDSTDEDVSIQEGYDDWSPRYDIGFTYYYPWRTSFYWGTAWYADPFYYDPWYYGYYYSPWYTSWYYPHHYYSHWYPRSYYYYGGYYPGYYSSYQPYVVNQRTRRESGYRRTADRNGTYTRAGSYGTVSGSESALTRSSRTSDRKSVV